MRSRGQARCLAALAVLTTVASFVSASAVAAGASEEYSPAILRVMSPPSWFRGADERSDAGPHRDELPLGRDLVTFAKQRS